MVFTMIWWWWGYESGPGSEIRSSQFRHVWSWAVNCHHAVLW